MPTDKLAALKLSLDASQLKTEAVSASAELQGLQKSINDDKKALRDLKSAAANLKLDPQVDMGQWRDLQAQIESTSKRLSVNQGSMLTLGKASVKVDADVRTFRQRLQGLAGEAKNMGGPLGGLVGRFENITKIFGSSNVALIGAGVGIAAMGAAAVYGSVKLYDLATSSAAANRAELQLLTGLAATQQGLTDFAAAGRQAQAAVTAVASHSSLGRDVIAEYAGQLLQAGVSGDNLQAALRAVATTAAVSGKEAAAATVKQMGALDQTSGAVDRLGKKIDDRLGKAAAAAMLDSEVQAKKLHENIASMFVGIETSGLDSAKMRLTELFSATSASGQALRDLIAPLAQGLVDGVARFTDAFTIGMIKVLTWTAELDTAWMDLQSALIDLVPKSLRDSVDATQLGLAALATAAWVVVPAAWAAAPALWAMASGLAATAAGAVATAAPFIAAGAAIYSVINTARLLYDLFVELKPEIADFGRAAMKGLVKGFTDSIASIRESVGKVVGAISGTFKSLMGIRSPSTLFASHGKMLVAGLNAGIEGAKPALDRQIKGLVEHPDLHATVGVDAESRGAVAAAARRDAGAQSEAARRAAASVDRSMTNYITLNITSPSPREAGESVRTQIIEALRTVAVQRGAAA